MDTNGNQRVSCIANYSYEATEPDELSLRNGDIVKDVERLPGGWWRGELRGKRGMFPDNFVSVIDQNNARSGGVQGRCRAVFSYQPANADELPLCVGDVLEVLAEVEEGWWQGRRQGKVGVFPSNFVVMLDPPATAPAFEPAPALPPKPVKELCRVLFPYTAVNDDELSLAEGDVVALVSKDAPDRGWWRGELNGKVGLFPDNFVQLLPPVAQELEEKKPDRPPVKAASAPLYPVLNKYSEKVTVVKEITTSKTSLHKENTSSKESNTASVITHTSKSETDKVVSSESAADGVDGQIKKPPVPTKKSPTPSSGVGGLFSGLKSKMLSSSSDKEKSSTISSSGSNSSGEWDKPDGGALSRANAAPAPAPAANTGTFDHVERNSILNDPRAQRVKAPRRRPPSQVLRDDTPQHIGLSNGHEDKTEPEKPPPASAAEEIKPRAREWEKRRAPWMDELKLNQAKKTGLHDSKAKGGAGSTDRLIECGLEEKKSTHSMEMSKSTSSISNRISVLESFEEQTTKVRHSLDSATKKESAAREEVAAPRAAHSPTAAGRTLMTMLEDLKKPPPAASARDFDTDRLAKNEKITSKTNEINSASMERTHESFINSEKKYSVEEKAERVMNNGDRSGSSLERRPPARAHDAADADRLIAQLNSRITNLEKLLEVQNAKFTAAIEELNTKLVLESEKRQALQSEVEKLAHCVTQV